MRIRKNYSINNESTAILSIARIIDQYNDKCMGTYNMVSDIFDIITSYKEINAAGDNGGKVDNMELKNVKKLNDVCFVVCEVVGKYNKNLMTYREFMSTITDIINHVNSGSYSTYENDTKEAINVILKLISDVK